ncbi:response regulator [Nitrosopumilus adriaticus]|uniref:Response regulator receiver protein n=1 Tax=Nitrosopumilus adriaticus TaxID=1580092 RepID=A0A0D5C4N1_9ARCH|nr:response regulator [Nitrosopumilus adriaticus]AJW71290.1 Response regulator receiver protein [Nitrosopumilus adriaticus]
MKILTIDDNQDITELLTITLTAMGHEVTSSNTGQEGLKLLTNNRYDVVLLDLAMPDFSGRDVINKLETMGNLKDFNIVIFTASSINDSEIESLIKKGVCGIIRKPIEVDQLEKEISKLAS